MITSTFGFYFIQMRAAMLRLCMGCVLCSLFFEMGAAHAAQPEAGNFATGVDLYTIPLAHSVTANNKVSDRFGFAGSSNLPENIKLEEIAAWVASIRWHLTAEDNRASLSPHLRIQSKETRIEIKPIQRSVWMVWHRQLD
jgi:hypothetical protein